MAELKKKQYGYVTVFYEENEKGEKVIRKLRFLGEKKNEYIADGDIQIDVVPKNSVGTEQIVDDSIEMDDLNRNVKDQMVTGNDRVTAEDLQGFEV